MYKEDHIDFLNNVRMQSLKWLLAKCPPLGFDYCRQVISAALWCQTGGNVQCKLLKSFPNALNVSYITIEKQYINNITYLYEK